MTGFGQAAAESSRLRVTVTLRGVNHRYLDLILRLRDDYRAVEPALREVLAGRLDRGRVETVVEVELLGTAPVEIAINQELVQTLGGIQADLQRQGLVEGGISFADLLRLPEVVKLQPREAVEWTESDQDVLLQAARAALDQMVTARETEGAKLRQSFLPRLDGLARMVEEVTARRATVAGELSESLRQRLADLLDSQPADALDESRLAQEVAYLVDKSDVAEELDRLTSHLEHFRGIMEGEGSLGKRLDFLTQEIFRELNTLGSKCRDSEMIRQVLDGKVLCEQIREQVQNVE